ncbi:HAD-IIB family hydrolase [Rhodoferax sp. U2-2l]|uniref:HAD-IIB family hydrolase n=1 Tax=Rhodoferax sp. U2-2l TaxID=2884000 RepID=UPI001D0A21CF|nr:HAD-IIB family hydrolase [Rhodoferax sp. U2-2l]MCB8746820.1 HAD-IIB family hydrolase [Rhodoferax sp. U2-2l]
MRHLLLCTDLDRTLIPNGRAPESPQARRLFAKLAACPQVTLAYVTGRHQALIQQAMLDYDLPTPAFAIADVGASLYQVRGCQWQRWTAWDDHIAPDWGGTSHTELRQLLSGISALTLQEPHKQARHKLSFYAPMQTEPQALLAQIEPILRRHGVRANLIWSLDEATQQGLLDILPARANKLHAIAFLMAAQGFERDATVFVGDSGNDLEVLQSDLPAVLVANADADIKSRVANVSPDRLYLARGDFLGMNGNYSAGILEGVAHHHPDIADWLHQQR